MVYLNEIHVKITHVLLSNIGSPTEIYTTYSVNNFYSNKSIFLKHYLVQY